MFICKSVSNSICWRRYVTRFEGLCQLVPMIKLSKFWCSVWKPLKSKGHIFPLACSAIFFHLDCFVVSCIFVVVSYVVLEVSVLEMSAFPPTQWNLMVLVVWCSKCQRSMFDKLNRKCLFPETMTQLLKLIHRPRCEHVGSIFFKHHCTEGSVYLLFHE